MEIIYLSSSRYSWVLFLFLFLFSLSLLFFLFYFYDFLSVYSSISFFKSFSFPDQRDHRALPTYSFYYYYYHDYYFYLLTSTSALPSPPLPSSFPSSDLTPRLVWHLNHSIISPLFPFSFFYHTLAHLTFGLTLALSWL